MSKKPHQYREHIERYLSDARDGKCKIFTSSVTIVEIDQRQIDPDIGTPDEFFDDLESFIHVIDPVPQIMRWAGDFRSHKFEYSKAGNNTPPDPRVAGTGDAIFLATALWLIESGEKDLVFHTFDKGGNPKGWEGKCIPILGLEDWTKGIEDIPIVQKFTSIRRKRPVHQLCPIPSAK